LKRQRQIRTRPGPSIATLGRVDDGRTTPPRGAPRTLRGDARHRSQRAGPGPVDRLLDQVEGGAVIQRWACRGPTLRRHGRACPGLSWLVPAIHVFAASAASRRLAGMRGRWVYSMTNRPNGRLYTGVTADMSRRAYEHREGLREGFTKRYRLIRLPPVDPVSRRRR
jgi:GIY-YIG catalytic domain